MAAAHCLYYADFLRHWEYDLNQGDQTRADTEIETELENIRAAWQTAIQQQQVRAIETIACVLYQFGQLRGRYLEIVGVLEQALPVLEARNEWPGC